MPNVQWDIDIHHTVVQVLFPLPARLAVNIRDTIASLESNPRPANFRIVEGFEDTYEVTTGFFRIVYQIQEKQKRIKVAMVNLRID